MLVENVANVRQKDLSNGDTIRKTAKRVLISEEDGAPNFRLRQFSVEPGGHTPWHQHDWEHENYFVSGRGVMVTEDEEIEVKPGMFAYVAPGEKHQYKNPFEETFEFLCLIPIIED